MFIVILQVFFIIFLNITDDIFSYNNNMAVMYEQETANLYSIGMELPGIKEYVELAHQFSIEKIGASRSRLRAREILEKEMLAKEDY